MMRDFEKNTENIVHSTQQIYILTFKIVIWFGPKWADRLLSNHMKPSSVSRELMKNCLSIKFWRNETQLIITHVVGLTSTY